MKSTHLEWKEGPYAKEGVKCHDCHMTYAEGYSAAMGNKYPDVRQHLFHGAHDPGKVRGTVELRIHPDIREAEPGDKVKFTVALFNQKTGHKFPSGSVEDRIVWMHVEAVDATGKIYHLPVDKKGFAGRGIHHRQRRAGLPGHGHRPERSRISRACSATASRSATASSACPISIPRGG